MDIKQKLIDAGNRLWALVKSTSTDPATGEWNSTMHPVAVPLMEEWNAVVAAAADEEYPIQPPNQLTKAVDRIRSAIKEDENSTKTLTPLDFRLINERAAQHRMHDGKPGADGCADEFGDGAEWGVRQFIRDNGYPSSKTNEIPVGALMEAVAEGMCCADDAGEDPMPWIQSCLSRIKGVSDIPDGERLPSVKLNKLLNDDFIEELTKKEWDRLLLEGASGEQAHAGQLGFKRGLHFANAWINAAFPIANLDEVMPLLMDTWRKWHKNDIMGTQDDMPSKDDENTLALALQNTLKNFCRE